MSDRIEPPFRLKRGDLFVAYPGHRFADRLFVEVTRTAKDGSWADIKVCTWAVMWTKRQPTPKGTLPDCVRREWNMADLAHQEADWERKRQGLPEAWA